MSAKLTSIQVRKGTRQEWESANPILLEGEIGLETTSYRFKVGHRDNVSGQLIAWNDLDFIAPKSTGTQISEPQTGDFWVDNTAPTSRLYYFDGTDWREILLTPETEIIGNVTIDGSLNTDNMCIQGNLIPCIDMQYDLGDDGQRWKNIHLGPSSEVSFEDKENNFNSKIHYGVSDSPLPDGASTDYKRLQIDGTDIATRTDLQNLTSDDLPLWATTDDNGNLLPTPSNYQDYQKEIETGEDAIVQKLPPEIGLHVQANFNFWAYEALHVLDDSIEAIIGDPNNACNPNSISTGQLDIYNNTHIHCDVTGKKFVKEGGIHEEFLRANGDADVKLPLEQSYWTDVPPLL